MHLSKYIFLSLRDLIPLNILTRSRTLIFLNKLETCCWDLIWTCHVCVPGNNQNRWYLTFAAWSYQRDISVNNCAGACEDKQEQDGIGLMWKQLSAVFMPPVKQSAFAKSLLLLKPYILAVTTSFYYYSWSPWITGFFVLMLSFVAACDFNHHLQEAAICQNPHHTLIVSSSYWLWWYAAQNTRFAF